jgi:SAM-dependent methyltransferase
MALTDSFLSKRFPRSCRYNPDWLKVSLSGGANPLWLAEWLSESLDLRAGMRVLDLGAGRAASSIFLAREFGVQVWSTDLWISASENWQRIRDADADKSVFPIHADARSLPFARDFFDAIVCIDCFYYFGTDDLYLNYLSRFLKPGGQIGIAGVGLVKEFDGPVPDHLKPFWTQDLWCMHSAEWTRRHWERTGIVTVDVAESMPDGGQLWLDWHMAMYPDNNLELETLRNDQGRYLGYIRVAARKQDGVKLEDYCWPDTMPGIPPDYTYQPLLRPAAG